VRLVSGEDRRFCVRDDVAFAPARHSQRVAPGHEHQAPTHALRVSDFHGFGRAERG